METDGVDPVNADPFLKGSYFRELAWDYIRRQPGEIAWGIVQGMARFWLLPDRVGEIASEVIPKRMPARRVLVGTVSTGAFVYHLIWLLLLGVGVVCAWHSRREWFWMFLIVALYLTLSANAAGNDRFRMQSAAFAFPLVGLGYARVVEFRKNKIAPKVHP
ncbi:MAG: hypothetical protein NZ874_07195 [Fimbriimonadales bacterium]|nr:hypothetical protein [Fimbriimonadales bacterium]